MNIAKLVGDIMQDVLTDTKVTSKIDARRVVRLRVSSFPFCGLEWFLNLPIALSGSQKIDALSTYYFSVGHAVHDTMQKALIETLKRKGYRKVKVYGDWFCPHCKTVAKFCPQPAACSKCRASKLEFREIELDVTVLKGYPSIVGHIDTLLSIEINGVEVFVVIDYKTSSMKAVRKSKSDLPYLSNAAQIKGYVALLKIMGKNVNKSSLLIYMPRDDPKSFKVVPVVASFKKQNALLKGYVKDFQQVTTLSELAQVRKLVDDRKCSRAVHPDHRDCKWSGMCAGKDNIAFVRAEAVRVFKSVKAKLPVDDGKSSSM